MKAAKVRSRSRLKQALEAVAGLWKDRHDIDPVKWQRDIRREWDRSTPSLKKTRR